MDQYRTSSACLWRQGAGRGCLCINSNPCHGYSWSKYLLSSHHAETVPPTGSSADGRSVTASSLLCRMARSVRAGIWGPLTPAYVLPVRPCIVFVTPRGACSTSMLFLHWHDCRGLSNPCRPSILYVPSRHFVSPAIAFAPIP